MCLSCGNENEELIDLCYIKEVEYIGFCNWLDGRIEGKRRVKGSF